MKQANPCILIALRRPSPFGRTFWWESNFKLVRSDIGPLSKTVGARATKLDTWLWLSLHEHARARTRTHAHARARTHAHARAQARTHSTHARATQARRHAGTQPRTLTHAHVRTRARTHETVVQVWRPALVGLVGCMQVGQTSAVRAGFAKDLFRLAVLHWTSRPRVTGRVGLMPVALVYLNEIQCARSELEVSSFNWW